MKEGGLGGLVHVSLELSLNLCYINHKIIITALLAAYDGRVQVLLPLK